MSNSILTSVKTTLGLPDAHTAFDSEIILYINSALSTLTQLGVGNPDGFSISSKQEVWSDFIGNDPKLNTVKTYVSLKVRMLHDPPEIGFVITEMRKTVEELEWRINVQVDDEIPAKEVDYDSI